MSIYLLDGALIILFFFLDDIPIQTDKDDAEGGSGLLAISEEREDDQKAEPKKQHATKENTTSSALAGVKNLPKTISGLGKKVKETKAGLIKTATQNSEKEKEKEREKIEATKKLIEAEKDAVKYDMSVIKTSSSEEIEFKRIDRIITDNEKVSLVSDSLKANDVLDAVATNGATKVDSYSDTMNNTVHVSSV